MDEQNAAFVLAISRSIASFINQGNLWPILKMLSLFSTNYEMMTTMSCLDVCKDRVVKRDSLAFRTVSSKCELNLTTFPANAAWLA